MTNNPQTALLTLNTVCGEDDLLLDFISTSFLTLFLFLSPDAFGRLQKLRRRRRQPGTSRADPPSRTAMTASFRDPLQGGRSVYALRAPERNLIRAALLVLISEKTPLLLSFLTSSDLFSAEDALRRTAAKRLREADILYCAQSPEIGGRRH